jgi:hypothetical protein
MRSVGRGSQTKPLRSIGFDIIREWQLLLDLIY